MKLELKIDSGRNAFVPRETLRGRIEWVADSAPSAIEVRLLWFTEGRGDSDVGVAHQMRIEAPSATGGSAFAFDCPSGPYSFSGRLISLRWTLEATALPGETTVRTPFVLAPDGEEANLLALEA